VKVEIVRTHLPVLTGAVGQVVGYDYVPWSEALKVGPLIEARLPNGHVESLFRSDVRPAK
jgi:hypothetical protein